MGSRVILDKKMAFKRKINDMKSAVTGCNFLISAHFNMKNTPEKFRAIRKTLQSIRVYLLIPNKKLSRSIKVKFVKGPINNPDCNGVKENDEPPTVSGQYLF